MCSVHNSILLNKLIFKLLKLKTISFITACKTNIKLLKCRLLNLRFFKVINVFRIIIPLRGYDKQGRYVLLLKPGNLNPSTSKLEDLLKVQHGGTKCRLLSNYFRIS